MEIPGEGCYRKGDVRWGAQGYGYGPEIMGPMGAKILAIQKDIPLSVDWI